MLYTRIVSKVNSLLDSSNDYRYEDMIDFFDEAIDYINEAIHEERYAYFPQNKPDSAVIYSDIPDRYINRFICNYVASAILQQEDEFEEQQQQYSAKASKALGDFVTYYYNTVNPITLEEPMAFCYDEESDDEDAIIGDFLIDGDA